MFKSLVIEGNIDNLSFFFGFKFSCIHHGTGIIMYISIYNLGIHKFAALEKMGVNPP